MNRRARGARRGRGGARMERARSRQAAFPLAALAAHDRRAASMKPMKRMRSNDGDVVQKWLKFVPSFAKLILSEGRLRGGGAADRGTRSGGCRSENRPPDRRNSSSTTTCGIIFPSPGLASARNAGGHAPFHVPCLPRRGFPVNQAERKGFGRMNVVLLALADLMASSSSKGGYSAL